MEHLNCYPSDDNGLFSEALNEIHLKSTSSSGSNQSKKRITKDALLTSQLFNNLSRKTSLRKTKLCLSYQELRAKSVKSGKRYEKQRSLSCTSLQSQQYDHIQSKVKSYMQEINSSYKQRKKNLQENFSKKLSLEEINEKLSNELREKNEILQKMEENYQTLLLKYAEAQNKIDELRFHSEPKPVAEEIKCQAVVAPMIKHENREMMRKPRPMTLPIESKYLEIERENTAAVTPTDSEGVSSVITSMSGHSKILNDLEDDDALLTEEVLRLSEDFQVNKNPADTYNKVKNWQNSLPPLELIETPENNIYDIPLPNDNCSPSTNYKDINDSNRSKQASSVSFAKNVADQDPMKRYVRTLSLPSSLSKRHVLVSKDKSHNTIDVCLPTEENNRYQRQPASTSRIHNKLSNSLPSPKTGNFQNNIFIPSLNLENLTLSEDETTREKTNSYLYSSTFMPTPHSPPSYRTDSIDSCKATISQYSEAEKRPTFNKSTSITPDRSKDMCFQITNDQFDPDGTLQTKNIPHTSTICHICGEILLPDYLPGRSASYQDLEHNLPRFKNTRYPFNRSVSFNSDVSSLICAHEDVFNADLSNLKSPHLEQVEAYTNQLKVRSQVILKALTAHVKHA